jgi:predicted cobalt transporter CbtA
MNPSMANTLAIVLSALGTILILAGIFTPLGMSYGIFSGIACFIIAGVIKKMGGLER